MQELLVFPKSLLLAKAVSLALRWFIVINSNRKWINGKFPDAYALIAVGSSWVVHSFDNISLPAIRNNLEGVI